MNLEDIAALIALADSGTVHGAARALGVPRTTVRRRVRRLEDKAETALVFRGAGPVVLTPAGEVVAEDGRTLLDGSDGMLTRARRAAERASGMLRMILPIGMPERPRLRALSALTALDTELGLDVRELADPRDALHEPFELMLYFGEPPRAGHWISHTLRRTPRRLMAAPALLDRIGRPRTLEALTRTPLLAWSGAGVDPGLIERVDGSATRIEPWLISPNLSLLWAAAAQGLGVLWAPDPGLSEEQMPGPLEPLLPGVAGAPLHLRALSPRPSRVDARLRDVLTNVQSLLRDVAIEG